MRGLSQEKQRRKPGGSTNIKVGLGGLRDIEFLVQGLQLVHAPREGATLLTGNTVEGLDRLRNANLLEEETVRQLEEDYFFLRRLEHYLQILEDRQIHALPEAPQERAVLARRILGPDGSIEALEEALAMRLDRVHAVYRRHIVDALEAQE